MHPAAVRFPPTGRVLGRALTGLAARLTTPLLPDDVLALVDPLWSGTALRARVEAVHPEAGGATTLVLRPGRGGPARSPARRSGWVWRSTACGTGGRTRSARRPGGTAG